MFASGNDREISGAGCSGGDKDDEDDEADEGGGGGGIRGGGGNDNCDESGKKQRGGVGDSSHGCNRSAKHLLLYPFSKARRKFRQRKNRGGDPSSSSSAPADVIAASAAKGSSSSSGMMIRRRIGVINQTCFCFTPRPQNWESSADDSPNRRNSNSPNFADYLTLKSLIERNDFYSKDCNPHLDIDCNPL